MTISTSKAIMTKQSTEADYRRILEQHTKALEAHTKAMNKFAAVLQDSLLAKAISRDTIRRRLAHMWGKAPTSVKEQDPIGNYVKGGPGVMSAYWAVLNHSAEFGPDQLDLQTNDTAFVTNVGELINAISAWYTANGWRVIS